MRFFWQKSKPVAEAPKSDMDVLRDQMISDFESDPITRLYIDAMRRGDPAAYYKMGEYLVGQSSISPGDAMVFFLGGARLGDVRCLWKIMELNIKRLSSEKIVSFEDYYEETKRQINVLPFPIKFSSVMNDTPLLRYFQHVETLTMLISPQSMKELSQIKNGTERFAKMSNELYVRIQTDGVVKRSGEAAALFGMLMENPPDQRVNLVKAHLWYRTAIENGFALVDADLHRVEKKMRPSEISYAQSLFKDVILAWRNEETTRPYLPKSLKLFSEVIDERQA